MGWTTVSPWRQSGAGQNLTIGSTKAASTAMPSNTFAAQLSATGNCHVSIGPNAAAAATDMLIKATDPPLVVKVAPGDVVSVIQDGSSTGTLNVIAVTH